jgi:hypothetical protein
MVLWIGLGFSDSILILHESGWNLKYWNFEVVLKVILARKNAIKYLRGSQNARLFGALYKYQIYQYGNYR